MVTFQIRNPKNPAAGLVTVDEAGFPEWEKAGWEKAPAKGLQASPEAAQATPAPADMVEAEPDAEAPAKGRRKASRE